MCTVFLRIYVSFGILKRYTFLHTCLVLANDKFKLQGVSKKSGNKDFKMFYAISFILMSSQERYLSPHKIYISPVVLHIISFHSS